MNVIPQAMKWKYGANCSKTKDKTYIDRWEHDSVPKPTKEQLLIDIEEYETYLANEEILETQAKQDIENELLKVNGDAFKILKAQSVLKKIQERRKL